MGKAPILTDFQQELTLIDYYTYVWTILLEISSLVTYTEDVYTNTDDCFAPTDNCFTTLMIY